MTDFVGRDHAGRCALPGFHDAAGGTPFALVEVMDDGVLVVDAGGVIRYANRAAHLLYGRPTGGLVGTPIGVPVVAGEAREIELDGGDTGPRVAEMRVTRATGAGEPTYLAVLRDVTERRRVEVALREADRRKDAFLAVLSHELRNPLAPIRNAVALMRLRRPDDRELVEARDVIDRQVHHLTRLIDDLLDVSRLAHGKVRLRTEPVDLGRIVADALDATRPLLSANRHTLSVDLPREPVVVLADPTRLSQVLANLLNNASRYTEPGGRVWLRAGVRESGLVLSVRDTGVGIPPEMLSTVFELYAQVGGPTHGDGGGLGIGLTLVRGFVEMHGGTVEASSDGPGRGSEFVVRLPGVVLGGAGVGALAAGQAPPTSKARRVLIVDDNTPAADTLAQILELSGHRTRVTDRGAAALEDFKRYGPDVVLLDIGLPDLDGYEVARRLRLLADGRPLLIIAVTGYAEAEAATLSRLAGFDHHMVKPVDPDAILGLLGS